MDLAGFCDKNIIVSDEALHCGGGRGVKPFLLGQSPVCHCGVFR
mgnify:CR=1 FL=1